MEKGTELHKEHEHCGGAHNPEHNDDHHSHCGCHAHEDACCSCHDHGCGCGCDHGEENGRVMLARIIVGAAIFAAALILKREPLSTILFVSAYIILGYDIVLRAVKNLFKGHVFDENFLMAVASIGAFIVGEHPEAVAVMLFYQIGESLQDMAVEKSRKSITELMDIRPDYANIETDGQIKRISPDEVSIGDIIIVKNGEKIPLDGVVVSGESYLDTSALTGESVPRAVRADDEALSGSINTGSPLRIRVTKAYHDSTVSKILEMVESAQGKKAKSEKFITAFARIYTPIVVCLAALLMFIPPLALHDEFSKWIYRGLIFLVVSCPCALVVSIPLGFFAGIGCASRNGILVKGGNYLEALSKLESVVFDKTGTLTKGEFRVSRICGADEKELLKLAAYAEYYSNHPIAVSIKSAYGEIDKDEISDYTEYSGMGISAKINGHEVLAGNAKLLKGIDVPDAAESGSVVYVAQDGKYMGYIVISDEIKPDSRLTIEGLNAAGVSTIMLTGDAEKSAADVAGRLGIREYHAQLLPQDKVAKTEEIISRKSGNRTCAFVGDGINDAPVLSLADIGVAMGGLGADSAIEAADIVLMTDEPSKLLKGIKISKKTMGIIKQNIAFALGIKALVMVMSALGLSTMWMAIFADVGVALLAVLNALRALR